MKTHLLFIGLIFSIAARGQEVVISTLGSQTVYSKVANPISIGSFDLTKSQIVLTTDNGFIEKNGNNYFWTPSIATVSPSHIYCYRITDGDTSKTLFFERSFSVHEIGLPDIRWTQSEIHSGLPRWRHLEKLYLEYSELAHNAFLGLDSLSKIISFDVSIKDAKARIDTVLKSNGEYFPPAFNNIIGQCHPKTEITFFNIKVWAAWEDPKEYYFDEYLKLMDKSMFFILN